MIPFINLEAQQSQIKDRIQQRISNVLQHGKYIMGPEVAELEARLASFTAVKHAISCGNGTDALLIALMALEAGPNDAVFCPAYTFAATAEMIPFVGATPFFVDVDPDTFNISIESLECAIRQAKECHLKPAGVIAVDLFGLPANYKEIRSIASENKMWVIADAAQSFGATSQGESPCAMCDIGTTSFFPAKPLGCYGDGGAIFTGNDTLAERMRSIRSHGSGSTKYENVRFGMNSRLDTLQAAILLEKLAIFPQEIKARQEIADRYQKGLADKIITPQTPPLVEPVWAQYTLRCSAAQNRNLIMQRLKEQGIPTNIYYPLPLHMQKAYSDYPIASNGLKVSEGLAKTAFSIPMHPYLSKQDQDQIINSIIESLRGS